MLEFKIKRKDRNIDQVLYIKNKTHLVRLKSYTRVSAFDPIRRNL
jgi:hypothetical protein